MEKSDTVKRAEYIVVALGCILREVARLGPVQPDITVCEDGSVDIHWEVPKYELLVNVPVDSASPVGFYGDDYGTRRIRGTLHVTQQEPGGIPPVVG